MRKKETKKFSAQVIKEVKGSGLNWFEKIKQFLREVKVETKKVTWPSRREIISSTIVVIAFIIMVAAYFGIIDVIYTAIIGKFLG
ncbi:MAG TPA: preprotein translocase subunit SecE [Candidatus Desulfofervidus auxilii]|uniref:Protein translocase subunit SecE n=1 Tax=Desulfofervidus auxilii TaxID=1621989 RepID=A0A7C0U1Z4_DESA2|nr:preprotein translocase subunit SecE [Candidatus Desulfofervidus auxilii]HDD43820.1 preprotein translocase subunit SecE [Candidatus Desulfofervidus auxilii]